MVLEREVNTLTLTERLLEILWRETGIWGEVKSRSDYSLVISGIGFVPTLVEGNYLDNVSAASQIVGETLKKCFNVGKFGATIGRESSINYIHVGNEKVNVTVMLERQE